MESADIDPLAAIFDSLEKKFEAETALKEEIRVHTRQLDVQLRATTSLLAHVHTRIEDGTQKSLPFLSLGWTE